MFKPVNRASSPTLEGTVALPLPNGRETIQVSRVSFDAFERQVQAGLDRMVGRWQHLASPLARRSRGRHDSTLSNGALVQRRRWVN